MDSLIEYTQKRQQRINSLKGIKLVDNELYSKTIDKINYELSLAANKSKDCLKAIDKLGTIFLKLCFW